MSGSFGVADQMSVNTTFMLGVICTQRGASDEQLVRARVCAMVSPASGEYTGLELGKGWPVEVAPVFTAVNRPERPCERGFCAVAGRWQPLHSSTSPGRSCSQFMCCGEMRRALASRISNWKATFAGTLIFTEPSGSIGA